MPPAFERRDFKPSDDAQRVRLAPDGERLAYTRLTGVHLHEKLVVPARGWQPEEIRWSPDGKHIAYHVAGGPPPGGARAIAWASAMGEAGRVDGIAYTWDPSGASFTFVNVARLMVGRVALSDGKPQRLTKINDDGDPHFPPRLAVSPDGARLAFTSRNVRENVTQVWVLEAAGPKLLTKVPGADAHVLPFWAPTGDTLALFVVHLGHEKTALILVTGGENEVVYQNPLLDGVVMPAWSPSGRSIAFQRTLRASHAFTKSGAAQLSLFDGATRTVTPLCEPGETPGEPRFLDERRLAVDGGASATLLTFAEPL